MSGTTVIEPVPVPGCARHVGPQLGDAIDGKYVLRERIGQGGMGDVFLADQLALGRSVAIKLLQPELVEIADLADKMQGEAMLACHVRSPHCVEVFDRGALPDGTPYIVMQYVAGRSLGRVIADEAMPIERALDIFRQVLAALAATHHSGIIHGDVKTDNFLVECVGGADHVTMIDFGLAHLMGSACDAGIAADELVISGTPEYMAPEVAAGDPPLAASDLYGAGVILYELLTGTVPFRGSSPIEIMVQQVRDEVTPPSQRAPDHGIPAEVDRIVRVALDKRPYARFVSAAAFAREVQAVADALRDARCLAEADRAPRSTPGDGDAPAMPRRLARGSDCHNVVRGDPESLSHAIGSALRRGDVAAIADGYLALANALLDRHQVACAMAELQEGIDILAAGRDPRAAETPACIDRLVVALAALYDDVGDPRHARRVAASTDRSPTWTSAIG